MVSIQTLYMLRYIEVFIPNMVEEERFWFEHHGKFSMCRPTTIPTEQSEDVGRVSERTIHRCRRDFLKNGFQFSESVMGKHMWEWMFDNKIMADQERNWLKWNVVRKPKGDKGYSVIVDFKNYPNKQLLPS